ncbi:hypothetical protein [Parafrankia sp. EUN1f]|uniref:hypothetical protein n=1 Tax=Parafrankia sp. EUN1f TaxID=102897 RepID=UPI0001C459B1|nr:hypothetical protein [Parafrankia sp. EUN1f]EFC86504.1 hypothetical protein FrEUN1fDRAFT_0399 [Parafrankia sp. EUN1f]
MRDMPELIDGVEGIWELCRDGAFCVLRYLDDLPRHFVRAILTMVPVGLEAVLKESSDGFVIRTYLDPEALRSAQTPTPTVAPAESAMSR